MAEGEEVEVVEEGEVTPGVVEIPTPTRLKLNSSPGTEAPSILIFPQASGRGAAYIIAGGARLIFVRNQHPAHGKILLHQSNETGTSPAVT